MGLVLPVLHGHGSRKWGRPYLTREFYSLIGQTMADKVLLVMARRKGKYIAGAINFIGSDTLFGRHWGATEHHPFLHFEVCYYQAIEYAIDHKLARVEAGAQGEHKIARGYLPQTTLFGALRCRTGLPGARSADLSRSASAPTWPRRAKNSANCRPYRKGLLEQDA